MPIPRVHLGSLTILSSLSFRHVLTPRTLHCHVIVFIIRCWGSGYQISVDWQKTGNSIPLANLGVGRTAKAIASSYYHACVILDDDSVKVDHYAFPSNLFFLIYWNASRKWHTQCWGFNRLGQLGYGDTDSKYTCSYPQSLELATPYKYISWLFPCR